MRTCKRLPMAMLCLALASLAGCQEPVSPAASWDQTPEAIEVSVAAVAESTVAASERSPTEDSGQSLPDDPGSGRSGTDADSAAPASADAPIDARPASDRNGSRPLRAAPALPQLPAARQSGLPQRRTGGAIRDITFDTIKFEMDKEDTFVRSMLTPEIEQLTGSRVRIRGYILPSFQQTGITSFVLVRDNMECCFGPGAALYDCVVVEMQPGRSANFSVRPVAVEGVFSIRELVGPGDRHLAIYHLVGERVQ